MEKEYRDFRQLEHTGWERAASEYESRWTDLTSHFIDPLLRSVGVADKAAAWVAAGAIPGAAPGLRLLDVACGPGYVAVAALARGVVPIGIDFSARMVARARERHPAIEFLEGDAERLSFEASSFDAVVTNFGIPHLARPENAFAEARRVLRPGGRFGFTVWGAPEQNPLSKIVGDAIEAHADLTVDLPEEPARFPLCEPEECRRALKGAGFDPRSVTFDTVRAAWRVPTAAFLFEAEQKGGVRTAALLARQPADRLAAIRKAIEASVRTLAVPGGFAIPAIAHVVAAAVPA
jgi:SAM-dependent methyltransferase